MKRFMIPLSALLVLVLPATSLAQSASSASSMSSSVSSMSSSSLSASSLSSSSLSSSSRSSSLSSSSRSSLSSSRSSMTSRSSSVSSARLNFDDIDLDRYSDVDDWDVSVSIAVSALTGIDVLRGNDDGTFRPDRRLNRAEFIEIIMRLVPEDNGTVRTNCFPDVRSGEWYAEAVCRAKAMGIVRGNAQVGVAEANWRFEPTREVQYEEAVKVLAKLYALPIVGDEQGMDWYVPFIEAAQDEDLVIEDLEPGDRITRGEMARLTVAFVAHSTGQLEDLRDAEDEDRSSSSRMSSRSSSSRSSVSSGSSAGNTGSGTFDPLDDTAVRTNILVLGRTSPIIAGLRFFSNSEPILVDEIAVEMTADVESIASLLIYSSEGELLGTANVESNGTTFTADIPQNRFTLPRREDRSIYVRARLKTDDSGGVSGEEVRVESVTLRGSGEWSGDDYTTTSSDTFPVSQTAAGRITAFTAVGNTTGVLSSGTQRLLGSFRVDAESPVAGNTVRLTALNFDIEQAGGVTLSNVYLRDNDGDDRSDCTVSSSTVTCNSIPAGIGTVDDTRTIQVYGDVSVPASGGNQSLRLVLSDPGSPTTAGDVTWTDGDNTFTWVQFSQPVVNLTQFN